MRAMEGISGHPNHQLARIHSHGQHGMPRESGGNGARRNTHEVTSPVTQTSGSSRTSTTSETRNTFPDNFNRFRMGSINWGIWGCFIILTILFIPVHVYLKKYDYRGELMGVFFVITLLFLVCFSASMFHTKTRAILFHRLHLEEEMQSCPLDMESNRRRHPAFRGSRNRIVRQLSFRPLRVSRSTPDLLVNGQIISGARIVRGPSPNQVTRSLSQVSHNSVFGSHTAASRAGSSPGIDNSEFPPPYHEAILLPTPSDCVVMRPCETPPPPYETVQ